MQRSASHLHGLGASASSSRRRQRGRGFTYLGLLWWVAISGVLLAALGQQWRIEGRRQREAEMVFRAEQIQAALQSYQMAAGSAASAPALPERLEDLLEDKRGVRLKRHLRQLWNDPVTGGPWGLVLEEGRIRGVYSDSGLAPLAAPEGVDSYRAWRFEIGSRDATPLNPGGSFDPFSVHGMNTRRPPPSHNRDHAAAAAN